MSASEPCGCADADWHGCRLVPPVHTPTKPAQCSPEAIAHLPAAWVIWREDPQPLLGLLGLGTSWDTLSSTSLLDLGSLGAEVQNERYERRNVAGERLRFALRRINRDGELAGSFLQHRFHAPSNPAFAQVDRHDDQLVACWTDHIEDQPQLRSPIVHVVFNVGEESVQS